MTNVEVESNVSTILENMSLSNNSTGSSTQEIRERKRLKYKKERKFKRDFINIASLNIEYLTMEQSERLLEHFSIDVAALYGVSWQEASSQNGLVYKFISGSFNDNCSSVPGFAIRHCLSYLILNYSMAYSKILPMRLKGRFRNISLLSVQCPVKRDNMITTRHFYSKIEEAYKSLRKYDVKIILGDLHNLFRRNSEHTNECFMNISPDFTGTILSKFALSNKLVVVSPFEVKGLPNRNLITEIGCVLIDSRHKGDIRELLRLSVNFAQHHHQLTVCRFKQRVGRRYKKQKQTITTK